MKLQIEITMELTNIQDYNSHMKKGLIILMLNFFNLFYNLKSILRNRFLTD